MKKVILICLLVMILILMLSGISYGKVIATLSEVMNPKNIVSDKTKIYISEGTSVYIYSLKDFKLIKKFGKKGQGPNEFSGEISKIVPGKDDVLINSPGKISFYSKEGKYIREIKTKSRMSMGFYYPIKSGFVGASLTSVDKKLHSIISLLDKDLNKGKTLATFTVSTSSGKMDVFGMAKSTFFYVHGKRIYALGKKNNINVFNDSGNKLMSLPLSTEKIKLTKNDEKEIRKIMKRNMPPGQYEAVKNYFTFPEYYPELSTITVSNDTVYIMTFKTEKNLHETYLFDLKGKLKKKTFISFKLINGIEPYPFYINNGKVYQLIENEETEEWELHENEF